MQVTPVHCISFSTKAHRVCGKYEREQVQEFIFLTKGTKNEKNFVVNLLFIVFMIFIVQLAYANLNDGLVAYYPFNGNPNDESGNGNHGIVKNAVLSKDRFSVSEKSYSFDGNSYIQLPPLNFNSQLSISLWVNIKNKDTIHAIISKYDGDTGSSDVNIARSFELLVHASHEDKFYFCVSENGLETNAIFSSTVPNIETWYHIVSIFDNGEIKLYVNGSLENTETFNTSTLFQSEIPLVVGATLIDNPKIGNLCANGQIDDIRLYNRVLSESEILSLYNDQTIITGTIYTASEILGYSACVGGATIRSIETGLSATTDIYGFYEIQNITIGKHTLEISSNFFKPITVCVDVINGNNKIQPIMLNEPMCKHLFTQVDLNEAIEKVEIEKNLIIAQKDQSISELNESMAQMFTKEYLESAIKEAEKRGELKYDINNDGKVGLEEIIRYLEQLSCVKLESIIIFPHDKKYYLSD